MERRRVWIRRLFVRRPLAVLLIDLGAGLLLGWCLSTQRNDVLAHLAYHLSTYALVVTVVLLVRASRWIRALKPEWGLLADPLKMLWDELLVPRERVALWMTMGFNLLFAVLKLAMGMAYHSIWLTVTGIYYLALGGVRWLILRGDRRSPMGRSRRADLKRCQLCGSLLVALDGLLAGIVVLAAHSRARVNYPGALIYAMAFYAFYANIHAVRQLVKTRRVSPLLTAAKGVSLTAAMVSMLSLEVALITRFGGGDRGFLMRQTYMLGGLIWLLALALAVSMLARATRELEKL